MKILGYLWDIFFPVECLGCGRDNFWICPDCFKEIKSDPGIFYKDPFFKALEGVFVVFDYKNPLIAKAIKTYKYSLVKELKHPFGEIIIEYLKEKKILSKKELIVPVPLSRFRLRWRGFNQSELIASIVSESLNASLAKNLKKIKNTKPQARLDKQKRLDNIKNCFAWTGNRPIEKNILLIDDVMTTGATLEECAKTLKEAGAKKIRALVIAHG